MAEYDPMAGFRLPNPLEGLTSNSSSVMGTPPSYMNFGFSNPAINPGVISGVANTGNSGSILDSFFKNKNADGSETGGWGSAGLGLAQGLGSAYMGMKQFGMAKQQLAFQKDAFNKNYAAQRQSTNTGLEDRQNARVAAGGSAYQSVGDYMKQNRIA